MCFRGSPESTRIQLFEPAPLLSQNLRNDPIVRMAARGFFENRSYRQARGRNREIREIFNRQYLPLHSEGIRTEAD